MSDDDAFVDWLVADSYQDYRQQRAIRELGSEVSSLTSSLAAQRRESGKLRSELAKLQGTLDERVTRLTQAFDAFVELSDLRMTLALFDPPALIRHRVRQILADPVGAAGLGDPAGASGLSDPAGAAGLGGPARLSDPASASGLGGPASAAGLGGPASASGLGGPAGAAGLGDFADVPGYWLGPATRALLAALRGEEDTAALAEAIARDAARTPLFLTIAGAVADNPDLGGRWLPEALGPLSGDEPVTHAQRALWIAAAEGTFGAGGRELLEERLAALVKGLPPEQAEAWADRAGRVVTPALAGGLAGELGADLALSAGTRLNGLRTLCETTPSPVPSATTPSPSASTLAPGATTPTSGASASTVSPGASTLAPGASTASPGASALGEVLRSLVDEGSAEEARLIRRAGELRAVIENRTQPIVQAWDAPAGNAAELLLNDAFAPNAGLRGEVARAAGARWIVAAAETFAERASADPPQEARITIAKVPVQVRPNSDNSTALGLVRAEIERRYPEPTGLPVPTIALAVTGALLCLGVLAWPNGLAIVAVLAGVGLLIAAGVRWRRARRAADDLRAARDGELQHAERQIQKTSVGLLALRERLEETRKQAATDLAAIRAKLPS